MFLIQHTTMNAPYVELGANSKSTSNNEGDGPELGAGLPQIQFTIALTLMLTLTCVQFDITHM